MKWGLVELHVDLEGVTAPSQSDAVLEGIRRDRGRADRIRQAIEHARQLGCEVVVLPGWTLVADRPPPWLCNLSHHLTIIAEMLLPNPRGASGRKNKTGLARQPTPLIKDGASAQGQTSDGGLPWESYVLADGKVVIGPAQQQVAVALDLRRGSELSESGAALVRALQTRGPEGRRWAISGAGEAVLLLCGEANLVAGGGPAPCWYYDAVTAKGLSAEDLATVGVVINPAHTWSGPQALRDKRAWLSRSGVLLHTANTFAGQWSIEGEQERQAGRASHKAAVAWVRGQLQSLEGHEGEGYVLRLLEWSH